MLVPVKDYKFGRMLLAIESVISVRRFNETSDRKDVNNSFTDEFAFKVTLRSGVYYFVDSESADAIIRIQQVADSKGKRIANGSVSDYFD